MSVKNPASSDWKVFDVKELKQLVTGEQARIYEFVKTSGISCAIYHLPVGSKDMQSPHLEDEVYVVIDGKGRLQTGDDSHDIKPGSILYVRANTAHSFFDIEEDLTVLAIFGPQDR